MVAIKYDVSDVESGGGGEEPQPATYPGRIVSMTKRSKLSDGKTPVSDLEVVCDIGQKYVRLWTYVKLPDDPNWAKESHGWKLRELTDALDLPPKGAIDPQKITKEKPPVLVKVTSDTHRDTGEYRGRIKNLFPIGDTPVPEEGDDAAPAKDGSSDDGPYSREDMEGWPDEDIRGYASELGLDNITGRGWKAKLLDAIEAAQEGGEDTPDNPGGEASTPGADMSDLDPDVATEVTNILADESVLGDWSDEDIKWLAEGLGIEGNVPTSGRGWQGKARAALVAHINDTYGEGADGGEGGGAPADDMDDVNDDGSPVWSDQDLKDEIATRVEQGAEIKIAGRWSREKAIQALREDNAKAEPF